MKIAFDEKKLVFTFREMTVVYYTIHLKELTNSSRVLDVIMDLSKRSWCSREVLGRFLEKLDEACEFNFGFNRTTRAVFCHQGHVMDVNWETQMTYKIYTVGKGLE